MDNDKYKYLFSCDGLRRMKRLVIWSILFLVLVQLSLAIGIARPNLDNNRLVVDADENATLFFQLQNGESSQKTVLFKALIQSPAQITDSSFTDDQSFQKQYVLPAGSRQDVNLKVNAPDGVYRIDYSYSEASTGGGSVAFSSFVSDSFILQSGDGLNNYVLGIPLEYDDYTLSTKASNIRFIDDLQIKGPLITVDYRGETIDLTGFNGTYVVFGTRKVTISGFPALDAPAKIVFENINSPYTILRDGVVCPTSVCSVQSYVSKRLTISVAGFSTYEIREDSAQQNTTQNTTKSNTTTGGSTTSGGTIPPPKSNQSKTGVPSNVVRPNENNNQPSQTSSTGSAGTPSISPPIQQVDKPVITNPIPPVQIDDKKKMIVGVFAAVGLANLILAMVLFRNRREEK